MLEVAFTYQTATDSNGNALYCFVASDGAQSPTLHVQPGDHLRITLTNSIPPADASSAHLAAMPGMAVPADASSVCGAISMTPSSVNLHFHGTHTPPTCHQDEVIRTLVNSGDTFQYDVQFPKDEPPGLYWYHPHVHGNVFTAVQGGATGALIVEGIQNVNATVAGLPQQLLIIRDNAVPGYPKPGGSVPSSDLSLNYVPISYPSFTPAVIRIKPGDKQFWRALNASADTIIHLQLQYDGIPQPLEVVALDGVPTGSEHGTSPGKSFTETDVLLAPAARAEFIVTGPSLNVQDARLLTLNVDTGPDGENDPTRPLAIIRADEHAPEPQQHVPYVSGPPPGARFAPLASVHPNLQRRLYFSETAPDPSRSTRPSNFFITVDGHTPKLFSPDNPPGIVTTQGSVEDWIIENRTYENHEFHIHQLHFLVREQDGAPVTNPQYLDTIQVPYWTGSGPYPSVKLRMDFRGVAAGDFLYHCHIVGHEDNGMMAIIRVKPFYFPRFPRPEPEGPSKLP